ncbi:MAG: MotA/TolQ/ExbB proton channel family protein [Methylobacter sp.]|jgi:chemotaxis protein MotA|nr:MotA/TolQ/ExbB proton channel family protein [Methylobacter sp.]
MDIASLVGFLLAIGIIFAAILSGGDLMLFVDVPSIMVVFGGTFGASLIRIPISELGRSFSVVGKAFFNKREDPQLLIEDAVRLSGVARKTGLLALDNEVIENPFLKKGISLCVDGHDPELVRKMLTKEIDQMISRNESGQSLWKGVADLAPAMGMIGTLVGLVQMLANMSDPASIGPAMAIALLTTLYGAMIANCFAIPIIDKLATVLQYEQTNMELIVEIINGIQEGMNPKILETLLTSYISNKKRKKESD